MFDASGNLNLFIFPPKKTHVVEKIEIHNNRFTL